MVQIKVDGSEKTAPPKKPSQTNPAPEQTQKEKREDAFLGIGQIAAFGCIITGNFSDAGAINMHWGAVSHEGAELAENNEYVARVADALANVGPFAALFAAAMPLAIQLMVNHHIIPASKVSGPNIVAPEMLEAQVKTQLAKQAIEVLRQQQEAEAELERLQREMQEHINGESANVPA